MDKGMTTQTIHALYVEDDPLDARLLQEELRLAHSPVKIELQWVDRLEEGLRRFDENRVDVVLLDLDLPDSTGLETLHRVLRHNTSVPVVVMTGRTTSANTPSRPWTRPA
jgi:DNA-binding response OmpR family regulator